MPEVVRLMRVCNGCQQNKPVGDEFYAHWSTRCRQCVTAYNKVYYEKNKEVRQKYKREAGTAIQPSGLTKNKEYALRSMYGLSVGKFNAMLKAQGFKCGCCGGPFDLAKKRPIHVDHDHETGKVRGLTCNGCNLILGHAKDSVEVLQKAIRYLKKGRQQSQP